MSIEKLYPAPPAVGQPQQVAEGIWWVRLPLPFALDHINVWLLEDGEGFALVDCGAGTPEVQALWNSMIEDFLQGRPITRIINTHCHPDHIGMTGLLSERFNAPVWMTTGEFMTGRVLVADLAGVDRDSMMHFYASHGMVDHTAKDTGEARGGLFAKLVPSPAKQFVRMREGDVITIGQHTWRVWIGYGHSPEHASLISESAGWMISGDMLLPTISTNVSVFPSEPFGNPLNYFLSSVERMLELNDGLNVLPSHGLPFKGIHVRCQQLIDHHVDRLQALEAALTELKSARDIIPVLFRRELDGHQLSFAMGEAVAHLHYLFHAGKATRTQGEDGVWRFMAKAA